LNNLVKNGKVAELFAKHSVSWKPV